MITKNSFHLLTCLQGWGLPEGFIQAGFTPVAHVEMNSYACQTLETRAESFKIVDGIMCQNASY